MPRNLQKRYVKQKSRIEALNVLGTPGSSRAGSEVEDELDTLSEASFNTADSSATMDESTLIDELRRCVDDLGEKRSSTREAALTKLNNLLAHRYWGSLFSANETNQEALLQLMMRSLRKPGSPQEAAQAALGVGLAFVNQGSVEDSALDDLFGGTLQLLKNTIERSLDVQLKHQCIETLALITFIAASDADTKGGMEYFYKILATQGNCIQPEDEEALEASDVNLLLEASLRAYGLLFASVFGDGRGSWEDAWDESQSVMPAHLELLQSQSKQVRVSAGETVALMLDCVRTLKKAHNDEADDDDEAGDFYGAQENDLPEYAEMDDLLDIIRRLASDNNRKVKKQDRKEQKSAFRDIVRSIEEGIRPKYKLKLGGQQLQFRGWAQLIELRAFRNFLHQGIARHFQENELLQSVFAPGKDDTTSESEEDSEDDVNRGVAYADMVEDQAEYLMPSKSAASKRDRSRRLKRDKLLS